MDPRLTAKIAPFACVDGLHRLVLDDGTRVVVKRRQHAPQGFFAMEAHGLALLHAHTSSTFGLDRDGWCGDSPQRNTQTQDGWRFFAECRLLPQGKRAF